MCCPCNHCGKCADRQGRCVVCHEKIAYLFAPRCDVCGAAQPPAPGRPVKVAIEKGSASCMRSADE